MDKSTIVERGEIRFEEAFELTGHGKFNTLVLITSGLIMLNVSMESVGMSYVITAAECDLGLSSNHKGLITAAPFIGIICTSFLWGYLSDVRGRRAVMLPAMLASAVFSFASSFSNNVWMLAILRILTGCFVSASSATVYAYLGEMHINSRRSAAIAWGSVFISFSFIILPGLAWMIIPREWSLAFGNIIIVPWRVFVWSWCAPGILAALCLFFLPESPRYLFSAKGPQEALPVLAKMYGWNHGCSPHNFPLEKCRRNNDDPEECDALVSRVRQEQDHKQVEKIISDHSELQNRSGLAGALKNFHLLIKPPLLRCVIISHVCMFAVYMLSSGLYVWVPDILNSILQDSDQNNRTICQIVQDKVQQLHLAETNCKADVKVGVFPISMGMGVWFALVFLLIGVFINKVGKKRLYCGIMAICGLATVAAVFIPNGSAATAMLILALCSGCSASILASIAVDVFPTCLRAMAMCTMYMLGRTGAAVGSVILGAMLDTHCQSSITGFGVFIVAQTFLMFFWPNPKNVRSEMEGRGLTY